MREHAAPWLCGLTFGVALAVCLGTGGQLKYDDERVYAQLAQRLAQGQGFVNDDLQPTAARPPGYPFALSLVFRIHESVRAAKVMNAVALGATAWLVVLIVNSVAPAGRTFVPLLILGYPLFIYTGSLLYPQTLGALLFVLAIYLILRHPASWAAGLACGAIAGALVLAIPAFALVFAAVFGLLLIRNLAGRTTSRGFLLAFALAAVLAAGPWVVRSSRLFDRFVFISTNSGINLLYGNSENARYNTGVVDVARHVPPEGLGEAELDRHYSQCAKEWVFRNPAAAAKLYALKAANYFNFKNRLATTAEESVLKDFLLAATYYPLLLAGIVRLLLWRKYRLAWPEVMLYLLYFGNAFLGAVVYTRIRYRVPFDFLLVALVAAFIGRVRARASAEGA